MKFNIKKILKKAIIIAFIIYISVTLYNQQKVLNSYQDNIATVSKEIEEKEDYKNSLIALKDNVNSPEYIEKIAREKLQMYMPNEKVYKDKGN